ncbi:MAG TPA: LysM peptidoglycan-binding domain-containing protein [Verrucomicrobiae bacterium]|nr:LysM peptidoglycan-binding domain-containing protein [Verrucomicrobiae bacterium]
MKRFLVSFLILSFSLAAVRAQDDANQQQMDKLSGQIQDLQAAQLQQSKRIEALEKQISDLQGQLNQPSANTANSDDLKKLAEQVQEIDKKRQEDNDRVLKELERLEKSLGASSSGHRSAPDITPDITTTPVRGHPTTGPSGPQNGYDYPVKSGDTLLAIVKAYRAQGIKVTTDQVLKANPGLDPKNMKVGQKIFIPAPAQ